MNVKCVVAKILKILLNPPAINNCVLEKESKIGPRSELTKCKIGRYTYIGQQAFMVNVEVGAFCSIADRVTIGGANHPIEYVSSSPVFHEGKNVFRKNFSKHPVNHTPITIIENDVWIGQGAFIKAGVVIHTGAVIGMGSVVTHDIPPYEVWAGNPAKFIKKRFSDDVIQKLIMTKWWEYNNQDLDRIAVKFNNPDVFLECFETENKR